MRGFTGQRVLITGAASGLGLLLARRFAREGARLVLWDLDRDGLGRAVDELGGDTTATVVDLADPAAIEAAARECDGPLDILVNNAGVVSGKPVTGLTTGDVERTFRVNALAPIHTTRAFLPGMIERGRGHIVTIASAAGLTGAARLADYAASKHAAVGFDESLRMELRRGGHDIDTTLVCPYFIATGMFEGARSRFGRLLPILDPEYATDRILEAIRRRKRRLLMPRLVYAALWLRILPVGLYDRIADFLGLNRAMDGFRGRDGHR